MVEIIPFCEKILLIKLTNFKVSNNKINFYELVQYVHYCKCTVFVYGLSNKYRYVIRKKENLTLNVNDFSTVFVLKIPRI